MITTSVFLCVNLAVESEFPPNPLNINFNEFVLKLMSSNRTKRFFQVMNNTRAIDRANNVVSGHSTMRSC